MQNDGIKVKRASFVWNMIGSMVCAASTFILLLCVTRTVGAKEGGIFSLAFATAQILLTVGRFGVRFYQATDIREEVEFGTYLKTRVWFCVAMLLCNIIYLGLAGYDRRKTLIFVFVCLIKMVDAIEDVFHGQLQCKGHMDVAGKLLTVRNIATIIVFAVGMWGMKDLLWTCVITAVFSMIFGIWINVRVTNKYVAVRFHTEQKQSWHLVKECLPLFVGSFLSIYIYNAPKYAVDFWGTEEDVTSYAIIFMPAFVINMFSEFVFKPLLTTIAELWEERKFVQFRKMIARLLGNIVLIAVVMMVLTYFIGAKLLSIVYSVDIMQYRTELLTLMVSGGMSAAVYLLFNVLASVRAQNLIIVNYAITSCLVTVLSWVFAKRVAIGGAAVAYLISEIVLVMGMLLCTWKRYREACCKKQR